MSEVNLKIRGKTYPIVCDDGQEDHILKLADYVDAQLKDIAASGAADNDNHLLVLTSLILADRIHELENQVEIAEQLMSETAGADGQITTNLSRIDERAVAEAITSLANRISLVSGRLKNA